MPQKIAAENWKKSHIDCDALATIWRIDALARAVVPFFNKNRFEHFGQ